VAAEQCRAAPAAVARPPEDVGLVRSWNQIFTVRVWGAGWPVLLGRARGAAKAP